jgi:hypothetical protein
VQDPLPAAAVCRQPVAEDRSRAGKPELPAFAFIRGSSGWFPAVQGQLLLNELLFLLNLRMRKSILQNGLRDSRRGR